MRIIEPASLPMAAAFSPNVLLGAEKGLLDVFDPRLLLAGGMLSGSLLLFAIILVLVKRWRKKQEVIMPSTHEQLNSYRQLFDEGGLTKEEFDRIRLRLLERMRKETGLGEKPAAPAEGAAEPKPAAAKPATPAESSPAEAPPNTNGQPGDGLTP
jgi:hypothetical protein